MAYRRRVRRVSNPKLRTLDILPDTYEEEIYMRHMASCYLIHEQTACFRAYYGNMIFAYSAT